MAGLVLSDPRAAFDRLRKVYGFSKVDAAPVIQTRQFKRAWINQPDGFAKYAGVCRRCGKSFDRGDRIARRDTGGSTSACVCGVSR
jgi:hypothetical protein